MRVGLGLCCFLFCWSEASAWSPDGHERINRIAQGLLTGKHRDQIRSMMHSDVIDTYKWEENMTSKYADTKVLHWHRQTPEWTCGSKGGLGDKGHIKCEGDGNSELFCALAYFFTTFAHDALLQKFPKPNEPVGVPKYMTALQKIPSSELSSPYYLRWLTILVGDMHQPLHWLSEHSFGADIKILYGGEERTLLDFWESYIPTHISKLNKAMHPDETDKEYGSLASGWEKMAPTELFREWARDSAEKLCTEVYAPMTVNHADGTRIDSPFNLTEDMFQKWVTLAESLMNQGGERLAFVLNDIIEHKRHKDAAKDGRGLPSRKVAVGTEKAPASTTPFGKDGKASKHHKELAAFMRKLKIVEHRHPWKDAMWNLGIAALVAPSLLYVFEWHARNPGCFSRIHLKL